MKSVYIAALIGASVMSVVNAQCACAPTDNVCLNKCVAEGNSCVSNCRTDECYASCVSKHWPGVDPNYTGRPTTEAPTSAAPTSVAEPTTSAAVTSETVSASQSSAWSSSEALPSSSWSSVVSQSSSFSVSPSVSSSAWSTSHTASGSTVHPTASASILPNSGANNQVSKVVFGLGLACALYILQ